MNGLWHDCRILLFNLQFFCLVTENRTQDTGHARFNNSMKNQTQVRKNPDVRGCGRFLGDNHAAIPWL